VRLLRFINENIRTKHYLTSSIVHVCFNAILTNVCSKIDDLRVVSGNALIEFINIPFDIMIDHHDQLMRIFTQQTDIDWRNSQDVFALLVQLLAFDKYRLTTWLHCLMTAGELNHASQAVYTYLIAHKTDENFLDSLFRDLERIFREKQYSQVRIILPCIQACERLVSQSTFEHYYSRHTSKFVQHWTNLLQLLDVILVSKTQILNNNPTFYLHFIKLYCSLMQFSHVELRNQLVKQLTKFFLHQYPWVRRQAAQNFYDTCIMFNDELFIQHETDDDHAEQVMTLLTDTNWEEPLDQLASVRQTLLDLFHIIE
jgi:hypothetical protein